MWPGESLLPSGDKSWSLSRVQHRDNTLTECYHIPQVTHDSPPLGGHWEHWEPSSLVVSSIDSGPSTGGGVTTVQ